MAPRRDLNTYMNDTVDSPGASATGTEQAPGDQSPVAPPIFIVTCARSGSTLLRFLLDAHQELACPPEINLTEICASILSTWQAIDRSDTDAAARKEFALSQAHRVVSEIMGYYLQRENKHRFCDKSLTTADRPGLMAEVFPEAAFICVYRHVMDVVYSGIEASPWGFEAFGFAPYVMRSPANFVTALVEYWCDKTERMIMFERSLPGRVFRVYYEMLATEPKALLSRLFDFLGIEDDPVVTARAFEMIHTRGAADHKVDFSAMVHQNSIGRGSRVPVGMIPPPQRERMNRLLVELGYPSVDEHFNDGPSRLRGEVPSSEDAARTKRIEKLLHEVVVRQRAEVPEDADDSTYRIIVEERDTTRSYIVDPAKARINRVGDTRETIVMRDGVLERLASGELHPATALGRGDLTISAADGKRVPDGIRLTSFLRSFVLDGKD